MTDGPADIENKMKDGRLKFFEELRSCIMNLATLDAVPYGNPKFAERHGETHKHAQYLQMLDVDADFLKCNDTTTWATDPCRGALIQFRRSIHHVIIKHYSGCIAKWHSD